jgi:nicotinic acid phosphoribosyltransferase
MKRKTEKKLVNSLSKLSELDLEKAFGRKRAAMLRSFYSKLFMLGGFIGATDTYKRTMWAAVPEIALAPASYALTMRKGLSEEGAGDQLIMAGHEAMLNQWFNRPLKRRDIELAEMWFSRKSNVRAFPKELWDAILSSQKGDKIYLPMDVWGFPGGQAFLKGVPCVVFNGMGGLLSYPEPAMCRYFAPVIQATKARLMSAVTPRDAEFGLRAAVNELANIVLLLARYVGGRGSLTSNDNAEFLFPKLLKAIGTIGHEMMCSNQDLDRPLSEAEYEMMDMFVSAMGTASLLCDLVDATTVGFENAIKVIKNHPEATKVGVRVDSGDIKAQVVQYYEGMVAAGIEPRTIVFEDEVTPSTVKEVYDAFRAHTGVEPTMLFPGAGGYWWKLVHRDEVSAAYKRTSTNGKPNTKFSNSPGKESLSGDLRVWGRGDTMIVADASETIEGAVMLFVKLVDQGRIVYKESFEKQADRADATWGQYTKVELSPKVKGWQEAFRAKRETEVAAYKARQTATAVAR